MENEPELIRNQMQDTRTALTEKLEALEQHVVETVQNTTSTVAETVQSVKDAVEDTVSTVKGTVEKTVDTVTGSVHQTVETVKDAIDVPGHVQRHPWLMMLGSMAVGFVGGRLLNNAAHGMMGRGSSRSRNASSFTETMTKASIPADSGHHNGARGDTNGASKSEEQPSSIGAGLLSGLAEAYHEELDKLKGLGISAVTGVVRDLVKQSVSGEIGSRLTELVDDLTKKMGGKPFKEPLLQPSTEKAEDRGERREGSRESVSSPSTWNDPFTADPLRRG